MINSQPAKAVSFLKLAGGVLLGAVASGLAAAALSGAGTANATCASISGICNGGGCTSSPTSFAVGLGPNAIATANGLFDGAIANGITNGPTDVTAATSTGALSLAYAGGKNTVAQAGLSPADIANVAINVGQGDMPGVSNIVIAGGQGIGTGNAALNVGGNGNLVSAGNVIVPAGLIGVPPGTPSTLGTAFNVIGNKSFVTAIGPAAVAGTLGVNNHNGVGANPPAVAQIGPGLNIKTPLNP